jgi:WD40 repeat protein
MTRMLAARLSRALVGCYPRRWRQRYASELLDVLDQHRAGARTVLNLAGSAVSMHLDPAYRMEGLTMARFRRTALVSAAVGVPIALIAVAFGLFVHAQDWKDSHWHIGIEGGVDSMAFSPADQHVLVTATSGAMDGLDTLWNVASPSRPRQLANFEGGAPTVFAPDGRTVATVAFSGQPALWNVANLNKPARITTLRTGDSGLLWGEAFSPDGHILAAAYTDRLFLWNVTNAARPRLLRTLAAPVAPPAPAACGEPCQAPDPFYQGDIAFSPDGRLLASTAGRDQVALWNVTDPAHATRIATVPSESGFIDALAFSPRGNLLAGVSYDGTVTMFSLANPARPARAATMQTVTARQIAASACTGGCGPMYTLEFAPGGRALTAIASLSSPQVPPAQPNAPQPAQVAWDYVFEWNVTSPQSVTRIAVFSRSAATSPGGNSSLPLLAPDGRTLAAGAPFSSFGVTLWTLP